MVCYVSETAGTAIPEFDQRFLHSLEALPDALVLSDRAGRIVLVNANAEKMFGYRRVELLGQEVECLLPERFRAQHPGHRAAYYANPRIRPMGVGVDVRARGKDGTEFPVEISLSPIEFEGNLFVWAAIRNVADRERVVGQLRGALQSTRILRGLISICAWCKRIRDERGAWQDVEGYIESHSETKFTHGICQDCRGKLDPARQRRQP
jgi:PAS domain S-box-containing protein